MTAITIFIALILAPVVIVTGFFALEVFAGLKRLPSLSLGGAAQTAVIVIPAHDEEAVIGRTVSELRNAKTGEFAVLVVADNCTDRTAEAARAAGATVIIRNDLERRGKGFALAAAREHLRAQPPEVVVIVDADCSIDQVSLRGLVQAAAGSGRAAQAVNLLAADLHGPPLVQISTFAFMIKNLVRQRGLQRLAGRAHLTGTGMALPWVVFARADLGGSNIVEDLALGVELSEQAVPPMLVEDATVWSPPASTGGTLVQRRRWEGGYLATALRHGPKALVRSVTRADLRGLCAALDICIPPLALLVLLNAAAFALALAGLLIGASWWPVTVQLVVGVVVLFALTLAWMREGRPFASAATLLRLPLYVFWKLPLYLGLARRGAPKEWLRTGR